MINNLNFNIPDDDDDEIVDELLDNDAIDAYFDQTKRGYHRNAHNAWFYPDDDDQEVEEAYFIEDEEE